MQTNKQTNKQTNLAYSACRPALTRIGNSMTRYALDELSRRCKMHVQLGTSACMNLKLGQYQSITGHFDKESLCKKKIKKIHNKKTYGLFNDGIDTFYLTVLLQCPATLQTRKRKKNAFSTPNAFLFDFTSKHILQRLSDRPL